MIQSPERELIEWEVERVLQPELLEMGTTPAARALIGAAMVLERDGWCQFVGQRVDGKRCLLNALNETSFLATDGLRLQLDGAAAAQLELFVRLGSNPAKWNDTPHRTQAEVTDLLLEAARALEARP